MTELPDATSGERRDRRTATGIRRLLGRVRSAISRSGRRPESGPTEIERSTPIVVVTSAPLEPSRELRGELQATLGTYVRQLRGAGVPPEKMVTMVKGLVRRSIPTDLHPDAARELMEEAVRSSIDAYYAD